MFKPFSAALIPSEWTNKIAGSISVGNMIGLVKKTLRLFRELPENVVNGKVNDVKIKICVFLGLEHP